MSPPKYFGNLSLEGECSEGLDAFIFFLNNNVLSHHDLRTQRHRLDANKFPMVSVDWIGQKVCEH